MNVTLPSVAPGTPRLATLDTNGLASRQSQAQMSPIEGIVLGGGAHTVHAAVDVIPLDAQ